VAVLPVAVQIGGSPFHGAPPLRHVGLVCLTEDGGHDHHQVGIIVRVGVRLVKEVCVEELVVEVNNGRNVVVVIRVVVPRCAPLANGRKGCARPWRTALSTHPVVAVNGWPAVAKGGIGVRWKEGLLFGGRGQPSDTGGGRGGADDGNEEEHA
jgi:hypothetical protein